VTLYVDLETYCTTPITCGLYKYSENVEITLIAWAIDDSPVQVFDNTTGAPLPEILLGALRGADRIVAHNSQFDRVVLERHGLIGEDDPRWHDTMIRAYAHSLPGSLGNLSTVYKIPDDKAKLKEGRSLVMLFCKPLADGTRATRKTHPKEWAAFMCYAGNDIEAMRVLDNQLPRWNDTPTERAYWFLDQKINGRGFQIDLDLARAALEAVEIEGKQNRGKIREMTDGDVGTVMQRDEIIKHIEAAYGIKIPDLKKSTIERRLNDPDLPEDVKEILRLRLLGSKSSCAKYKTLLNSVNSDGRLRGTIQFRGASRTGRASGRIYQPQNLPRPLYKAKDVAIGIELLKLGAAHLAYSDVMSIASSALRGTLVAAQGKKIVVSDWSSIEGRMLAWLAGEEYKLKAYREYDAGRGYDMYVLTYATTFGISPADVDKKRRQLGKVLELAMGFGGGVGAFITFANGYGINLDQLAADTFADLPTEHKRAASGYYLRCVKEKRSTFGLKQDTFITCDTVKRMWRAANPKTVQFWYDLEDSVRLLIDNPHTPRTVGPLTLDRVKGWLRIRLPSGRYMCYPSIRLAEDGRQIVFRGVDAYTKKWQDIKTYGGRLSENATQASSSDVLYTGMLAAENAGYRTVLSVHDELITETPDAPEYNHGRLSEIMSREISWAPGLPLAAAGFESYRYKKED
jgi:DNA polymerase bacteriophage-type